jgi:hypothetical protein
MFFARVQCALWRHTRRHQPVFLERQVAGNVSAVEKDKRVTALRRCRHAWPLTGLALAANVLWVGVLGYALVKLL